ncbi:hypothetical protein LJR220_003310 [Bradyrhizobium sp. LjRoot220]|uniref:hypothetical protein n=1 Tax=Bradyrhizobium sp. LjRoot220 TaxID=3342284 RepID=UPI003ECCABB0
MKRPKTREIKFPQRMRLLRKVVPKEELEAVAQAALYAPSDYHCKIDGKLVRRTKPATPCPRDFTLQQAGDAMRDAIRKGRISEEWVNGFPRRLWHKEGDVWYEACTNTGTAGTYHAYPVEVSGLPAGLRS